MVGRHLKAQTFQSQIEKTFVNGKLIYDNFKFNDIQNAQRLVFDRS